MGRPPKTVWQFRKDGTFIREIKSLGEAARLLGCQVSNLQQACSRFIKCRGYYWKLSDGKHPLKIEVPPCRRDGKQVKVFKTKTGGKGHDFILCYSLQAAQDLTGVCVTSIRQICRGNKTHSRGYTFEFLNDEDKWNSIHKIKKERKKVAKRINYSRKPVKLTEIKTGKEYTFESITQAAKELGINDKGIRHVVVGRYKQTEGYQVEVIKE